MSLISSFIAGFVCIEILYFLLNPN